MISANLLCDVVTVVRRSEEGKDRYGAPVHSWGDSGAYRGRLVYPSGREETTERDAQAFGASILLPPHADVTGRDRVRVEPGGTVGIPTLGSVWEVDGPPLMQRRAFGPGLLKIRVKKVEG